jgi:hypothetical protein
MDKMILQRTQMTCSAALEKKGDIWHPRFTALRKAKWSPPTFPKEAHIQYPLGRKRGSGCIYSQDNATRKKTGLVKLSQY